MYFVITTEDKPDSLDRRMAARSDHLDYINNQDCLLLGGPLLTDDGTTPRGSLFIIDVEDQAAAESFSAGDPYSKAGLFAHVNISPWRPVVGPWIPAELTA